MARGWKTVITTEELVDFARRRHVPLGRSNPTRTLKLYLALGLVPGRFRIVGERRVKWGFPLHARNFLIRIRDLKLRGLTLAQIKEVLQPEIRRAYHEWKAMGEDEGLGGWPTDEPDWDYRFEHHEQMASGALAALDRGDLQTARRILREVKELARDARRGKRSLIVVGRDEVGPVTTEARAKRGEDRKTRELLGADSSQEAAELDLSTYVAPGTHRREVINRETRSESRSRRRRSRRRAVADSTDKRKRRDSGSARWSSGS